MRGGFRIGRDAKLSFLISLPPLPHLDSIAYCIRINHQSLPKLKQLLAFLVFPKG